MINFIVDITCNSIFETPIENMKLAYKIKIEESANVLSGDSFQFGNDSFQIVFDGVINNRKDLINSYGFSELPILFIHLYSRYGFNFVGLLNGNFRGIFIDKNRDEAFIFTNKTSSKPIYYYKNNDIITLAGSFSLLSKRLSEYGLSLHLDEVSSTMLLSLGYLLEDRTLAQEVKKLLPGCGIRINSDGRSELIQYHKFTSSDKSKFNKKEIINHLDFLFRNATKIEFEKDEQYQRKHLCTLSGGLDSRIVTVIANHLQFDTINITLSHSGYLDDKIAKKISKRLGSEFLFNSLDPGNYLKNIDENVQNNGGSINYSGSAHLRHVLGNFNLTNFGLLHTGLIGDGILGSFLSKPHLQEPSLNNCFPKTNVHGLDSYINGVMKQYESEEIFKLYQRGFNAVTNGFYCTNNLIPLSSPFLDDDFLSFALSIPENYKYQERIYRRWITGTYPIINKFIWERTGLPPIFPPWFRYLTKGTKYIFDRMQGNSRLNTSMNPEDYYYSTNNNLKEFLVNYLDDHIYLLENQTQLKNLSDQFRLSDSFRNRAKLLTLLSAVKIFKLK